MTNVNPAKTVDLNSRFFILQQKMFMENNIGFFKEYEALVEKWEGTTELKKTMKFISKLSTSTQTINLVEFYKTGTKKQPLWLSDNFQKILKEVTSDSETIEIDETFYQHQNNGSITENNVMAVLNESIIDLGTAEGRLEARKRLGALAYFLKQQPKAEKGDLLTNGYANVIGWFKTKSGSVFGASAYWGSGAQAWGCGAYGLRVAWLAGRRFWSRNEEA